MCIRDSNPLVRGIARIATSVQRKLLVAFAVIVVLLVTVGVLGLGVLSQSNSRADTLSQLPQRLAAYQQLKVDSVQLGGELQDRTELVVGCFLNANCATSRVSASLPELAEDDGEIESTLELMELETDVDGLEMCIRDSHHIFANAGCARCPVQSSRGDCRRAARSQG